MERYFFFGLLLATFIFTFLIFRPFWIVIILGACLAVILYPIFKWFKKIKFPNWIASILTVIIFAIIVCGPLLAIGVIILNQSQIVYHSVVLNGNTNSFISIIGAKINHLLPAGINFNIEEKASAFISFISNNITDIFSSAVSTFFSFILLLIAIFYFLKDGNEWKNKLSLLIPLSESDDQKIISRLSKTIDGMLKGVALIALIQGIITGIGFALFGVPNGALWGLVAVVVSIIPVFGTAFISVPGMIFLYFTGNVLGALCLLLWSGITSILVNNFLAPALIGKKVDVSSFLILFAIIGGIALLGPVGILIGPLTVSLLYALISIYRNEFKQNEIL